MSRVCPTNCFPSFLLSATPTGSCIGSNHTHGRVAPSYHSTSLFTHPHPGLSKPCALARAPGGASRGTRTCRHGPDATRDVSSLCSKSGRAEFGAANWCSADLVGCVAVRPEPCEPASKGIACLACSRAPRGRGESAQAALSASVRGQQSTGVHGGPSVVHARLNARDASRMLCGKLGTATKPGHKAPPTCSTGLRL